jgi:four helix bundle protein
VVRGQLKVLYGLNRDVLEFVHFEQVMCRAQSDAMSGARHFRELVCWPLAIELKLGLYRLSEQPEVKRDLRFCDQLRDAAASAPRNIAEGFGRRSHADFARFLDVTRGSLAESQNHLQDAVDRGYLDEREFKRLNGLSERACAAVARLQRYLRGRQR